MSANVLSSRAVIGMYYEALNAQPGLNWLNAVSNYFTSDQASENYAWIGMPPALHEWVGGRKAKGFTGNDIDIANKHYEATLNILLRDLRRDKTGQLQARIAEFAQRGTTHFASLVSTLIAAGETGICYDNQYFFDTDHSEGDSGTLDNDIQTDISGLPVETHGAAAAAPSKEEMLQAIVNSISQFFTFKDNVGEPINETAQAFHVMVPVGLLAATSSALSKTNIVGPGIFSLDGFSVSMSVNPRLTSAGWTDKFVTFRTDGSVKALIRQEETEPQLKVKDEYSEYAFDNDAIQVGIDTWRNAGYGRWQHAVLNTLI